MNYGVTPDCFAYVGYLYRTPQTVARVRYTAGMAFADGGWFKNGDIHVQVLKNGAWTDAEAVVSPTYPVSNSQSDFTSFAAYTFTLVSPEICDGVRIAGTGGDAGFISIAELTVD